MKLPCIFIVDDDTAILESFKIILAQEGYKVFTATNGSQLRALLSQHSPDLILMDYRLSGENGGKLTADLKGNPQTSSVPVIVISAGAKYKKDAILKGADDFIYKPIEIPDLLTKIGEHLIHG